MISNDKIKTVICIALGVCFVLSGLMKAVNVYSFAQEIRLYVEAYMDSFVRTWVVEMAVFICAFEIAVGLLALRREYAPIISVVFLCTMSFFFWLTGVNLFSPSLMGSVESCGCFGELVHFSPLASFVKSVVLWVMSVSLFGLCLRDMREMFQNRFLFSCAKTYVALFVGVLPPVYSYFCFENMEHGFYFVGYLTLCVALLTLYGYYYVNRG